MDFGFWIGALALGGPSLAFAQEPAAAAPPPGRSQPAAVMPAAPAGPRGRSLYQTQGALSPVAVSSDPNAPAAPRSYLEVPAPVPKVIRKHDLVTIIIREDSQSSSSGKADSNKEATLDARIDEFIKFSPHLTGGGVTDPVPSIKMSGKRELKSDGAVDRMDSLTFRITAEVLDVKPNGTLVLQARKRVKTDDEQQEMVMSGTCRVDDVQPDNTILSTQLHDLDVAKKTIGSVRDATKRGFLPKLLDLLNPF